MTNKNLKKIIIASAFLSTCVGVAFADGIEQTIDVDETAQVELIKPDSTKSDPKKTSPAKQSATSSATSGEEPAGSRVKLLQYDETNVYVIRTKYGYQTNIVFADNEEIQTISVGDRSLWQLIPAGNRLFIRPMSDNMTTNMTLLTNKHSYEFDLKSVDKDNDSNIYVAKFIYTPKISATTYRSLPIVAAEPMPMVTPIAEQPATPMQPTSKTTTVANVSNTGASHTLKLPATPSASAPAVEKPALLAAKPMANNYNYTYTGADAIAPNQVYDNGKETFINYRYLKTPLPEVLIVVAGGKEFLTTPIVQGNSLVINDVAGEIILRGNGGEIKIYNEALAKR